MKVPRSTHIANEMKVLLEVIRAMSARKWSLFIAPKDSGGFITSDNPVMLFHSDESPDHSHRPVGHGLMRTTLLFPVTRELMAIGKFEKGGAVMEIGPDDVAHFNSQVLHRAHRQIYAVNDRFQFEDWTTDGQYLRGVDVSDYMLSLRSRAKAEQDARTVKKTVEQ